MKPRFSTGLFYFINTIFKLFFLIIFIPPNNFSMKAFLNRMAVIFGLIVSFSFAASSQIVVRVRPAHPVLRPRPIAPTPRHIWIDGGWVYRGNTYVWTDGYWVMPRPNMIWMPGSWGHRRGGWVWIPGHWRRGH
jgi:WXXGXW repeat (2 copies)